MKPPVLFELNGILPANQRLLGQYRWAFAARLTGALLEVAQPPAATPLELWLEVDGVRKAKLFTIGPGPRPETPSTVESDFTLVVQANSWVRIVGDFAGEPEEAAGFLAVTLAMVPRSIADVATLTPLLQVAWVNGDERLILFTYEASTHSFTAGMFAAGRASITRAGDTSIQFFMEGEVMEVSSGKLARRSNKVRCSFWLPTIADHACTRSSPTDCCV
jgi:hypothetical protein